MSAEDHDPRAEPYDCLLAVLHEFSGGVVTDRGALLNHGLAALDELNRRVREARQVARLAYVWDQLDDPEWPAWLTGEDEP